MIKGNGARGKNGGMGVALVEACYPIFGQKASQGLLRAALPCSSN
jgi:hypothetical protein